MDAGVLRVYISRCHAISPPTPQLHSNPQPFKQCRELVREHTPVQEGVGLHFSASMLAGMFVAVAMNPFDVVTTRLYNQPVDHVTKKGVYYSGVFDCLVKTAKAEGFRGMYKVCRRPLVCERNCHTQRATERLREGSR